MECTGDTKVVVIAECGALRVDTALDEGKTARSGFEALEDVWDEYMCVSQSVKGQRVMIAHQWRPRATSARFLLCMVAWLLDYCDEGPLMFRAGVHSSKNRPYHSQTVPSQLPSIYCRSK